MIRAAILLLAASLALGACNTMLNPGNWFGRSRSVPVQGDPESVNPLIPKKSAVSRSERPDPHVPILSITDLVVERSQTGAIIRVEGLAAQQGAYAPRLTPQNEDGEPVDGVLSYTLEVIYPKNPRPVGPEQTRRIIAARSLTNQDLESVRLIRVTSAQNARESRRR